MFIDGACKSDFKVRMIVPCLNDSSELYWKKIRLRSIEKLAQRIEKNAELLSDSISCTYLSCVLLGLQVPSMDMKIRAFSVIR